MITKEEIAKLCELSRIEIKGEEKEKLQKDIEGILDYISQIKNAKVESMDSALSTEKNTFRPDEVSNEPDFYTDDLLALSPKKEGRFFKTKKIL
jgi:aspartyl-tRNA(Asn)/glutamyl-tRNA(Gln) amidotransferase subunit C